MCPLPIKCPPSADCYDMELRSRELESTLASVGQRLCEQTSFATGAHGGWCLRPDPAHGPDVEQRLGFRLALYHLDADHTLVPHLAALFADQSVLDMGAGVGQYGHRFQHLLANFSIKWRGYDGALNVDSYTNGYVRFADLSRPVHLGFVADWVMSLEVGEHIPAVSADTFVHNLHIHNHKGIVLSWAVRGQGGTDHVNELGNEEVKQMVLPLGYIYDERTSDSLRKHSTFSWFKNTIMVFQRITK